MIGRTVLRRNGRPNETLAGYYRLLVDWPETVPREIAPLRSPHLVYRPDYAQITELPARSPATVQGLAHPAFE